MSDPRAPLILRFFSDELRAEIRRLGLTTYADMIRYEVSDRTFDPRYGVRTRYIVDADELEFADAEIQKQSRRYRASAPLCTARALARLADDLGGLSGHTLVDYGCGAGRAMVIGAEASLRRVIGLDLSPPLAELARTNLQRYARRRGSDCAFEVLETDATRYEPPPDAALFYFYRPFNAPIFARTLARIRASVRAHPRDVYLMLNDAEMYDPGGLTLHATVHGVNIFTNRVDPEGFLAAGRGEG